MLDIAEDSDVVGLNEVDSDTLATETTRTADSVNVQFTVVGQVVVDDERHLLHINAASPDVGCDKHSSLSRAELLHDLVALLLRHVAVHGADCKVRLAHLLRQPVDLSLRVAEDDGLSDGERVVQVAQRVELPLLPLDGHEELLDAFQRQLIAFHQDADRIRHELAGHLEDLVGKRGRDEADLRRWRQITVNVVDLLFEAFVEHLVGLVQHQHLDRSGPQHAPLDHVEDAAGRSAHDVLTVIQLSDVLAQVCAADAGMALDVHEVTQSEDDLLDLHRQLAGR